VLRFRGQKLSDPQLLAFSRHFGELDPPGPNPYGKPFLAEHPEMNVISNIKNDGVPIGGLGDGEAIWHADMTYVETPPMGAILYALEVPPSGGDTYWANMYTAYEALPARLKKRIDGRQAVHDATYNSAGIMRKGYKESPIRARRPARGIRWCARIRRPAALCLFLGRRRNSYVVGLELADSEALLDELWAHATGPSTRSGSNGKSATSHLGQPLHPAPARSVRSGGAPADAPHADQGCALRPRGSPRLKSCRRSPSSASRCSASRCRSSARASRTPTSPRRCRRARWSGSLRAAERWGSATSILAGLLRRNHRSVARGAARELAPCIQGLDAANIHG
jgi:hypothetical protein